MELSQNHPPLNRAAARPAAHSRPLETAPAERHELFRTVVSPHLSDAARLARMFTRNRTDAEDVLQEATVRLLRFVGAYRGGDARSWVLRVTRNTAFTWLRRNRRPNHMPLPDLHDDHAANEWSGAELQDEQQDPFSIEARRAESAVLRKAISALPAKQQEIVILRDLHGLPYSEIAATLAIPLGTVMSRLSRTHAALRLHIARLSTTPGIYRPSTES